MGGTRPGDCADDLALSGVWGDGQGVERGGGKVYAGGDGVGLHFLGLTMAADGMIVLLFN